MRLRHRLLDDRGDLFGGLREDLVHVLRHGVHIAEVLEGGLRGLSVRVQRRLVLFQELLLDRNVVIRDA